MDNSQANNRGVPRGSRGGNPRGPRGGNPRGPRGGTQRGSRGGNPRGHSRGHHGRGRGGGDRARGRGGRFNHSLRNDAGSPSNGHPSSGASIKIEPVDQSSNPASAQQPASGNSDASKKGKNRPKGGNGIAGRMIKRKEASDIQEAEKKRRFDSGEVLPDVEDEYDFNALSAPTAGAASTSTAGGVSKLGVDGKSALVNPFTNPDNPGAEKQTRPPMAPNPIDKDAHMTEDEDEEADKVKAFLCNMLRRAMKHCLEDEQQAWKDYDQRVHLFGKYASSRGDQVFLNQLKTLRDGARALLRGKTSPLDNDTEGKRATLSCSITNLTPDNMRGVRNNTTDPISELRKSAAIEAAAFKAEVSKQVAVPKQENVAAFQQACTNNIGLWTQDIAHFSDVRPEFQQSLQEVLTFSNGLTQEFGKQGQAALNQCLKIDCVIKDAPTKGALRDSVQAARKQAEAECGKMPQRWVELMNAFKRKYFKLWSITPLNEMDKDTFLQTWENPHILLMDVLGIPEDNEASYFFLPHQLADDVDMGEADLPEGEFGSLFDGLY